MSKLLCPVCNNSVLVNPSKSWKFKGYDVKRYECQNCKAKFNLYQGPKGTYTIPKSK